ncbi:flagellar filament capping protein FliD [Clostridium sp. C2-6-12]|uniref:flagellar filament capping protein FliD n=1 Tax=Clostridium sp. C2-6-12 TaxID=2698832 RepID=UPI001FAB8B63|nr:flagellar filament capping protein FliD [Clostridium sp. C2-6-12]
MNLSPLTRFNYYNSISGITSNIYNNSNYNANNVYNKTNSTNSLSNFNVSSIYNNNTYAKKLSELQSYTKDSKEFYSDFVDKFSDLKRSSSALKSYGNSSVFKEGTYGSNDTSVVSVTSTNNFNSTDYKVEVSQLATGKAITYNELSSTGKELVKDGSISIDNGKNSYTFDVNTENALNNKEAINKIAETVNKADIGVKATVVESNGKSSLKLQSATTGENSKLEVTFGGDLNASLNVKATEAGKNVKYKVNDVDYTSENNTVNLSNTVKANLNGIGKAQVSSDNVDSKKVVDAVNKFASDYNKVVSFLDKNANKSTKIEGLADSFEAIKYNKNSLSEIRITVGDDGKLSVNQDKLKNVVGSDYKKVKNIFGGSSGIASETYNKVQEAMNSSKNLYPSFKLSSGDTSIYSSNNSNIIYSQYNSIYSSGLFLNSLR